MASLSVFNSDYFPAGCAGGGFTINGGIKTTPAAFSISDCARAAARISEA